MSKELPYFKFKATHWLTGDIVYEPFNVQGLFINICAVYWQREGKLTVEDINKRYKNPPELADLSGRFISITDGQISIDFLDEQFNERKMLCSENSKNGKKGAAARALIYGSKAATAKPTVNDTSANLSNKEKNKNKKRNIKEKVFFTDSDLFDKKKFSEYFGGWGRQKLKYYYESAERYSGEGHKYADWGKTINNWAAKDEAEGKLKFDQAVIPKGLC